CKNIACPSEPNGALERPSSDLPGGRSMSSTKTIALTVLGVVLSLVGGAILLFGLFNVVAFLAWGIGSFGDLFFVFLFVLYAIPAGLGSLMLGMFLQQSANSEVYVQPAVDSQKQLGRFLLLP